MRALALVEAPEHVCCRYRVAAFAPALRSAGCDLEIRGINDGLASRIGRLASAASYDAVLLQRKLLPGWQWSILRRRSRRLIFDFDDAVLYRDSYDPRGPDCPRRASRFARAVRESDVVIAGNDDLADCALGAGASAGSVRVIPTCVDTTSPPPRAARGPDAGLAMVWIGSSSTLKGLEQSRAIWERLGRNVPGLSLRVICDRFPRFDHLRTVEIPWSQAVEAEALAGSDVGVAWMPDDAWSRGKCGLKVLQYQAAGLPVVANPVGVHAVMIAEGRTGYLADSDDRWLEAILALSRDPDGRSAMGRAARADVAANYSVGAWAPAFVAAVTRGGSLPSRPAKSRAFASANNR